MKKTIVFIVALFYSSYVWGQSDTTNFNAGWGTLDYAVPESPAFKLLGNNPDNILQPTSVKSMAVSVGGYYLTNGNTIPKNLAVEISPLLLNGKASLNDYNNNKFWYRTQVSIGTSVSSTGGYNVAEGLRFTIIDKTDLRSNSEALSYFYKQAKNNSVAIDKALADYAHNHPDSCKNQIVCSEKYSQDTNFKKMILKIYANELLNPDSIAAYRNKMRIKLWNAPIWEAGIAAMQTSPDSLGENLALSKIGIWTTYGTHLSKNDQLLIGGNVGLTDSLSKWNTNVSIGARYYYGSNEFRAFIQGQYCYQNDSSIETVSLGCVFNITNGYWGQFTMNFNFDKNGNVTYTPGLNISMGTPRRKKSTDFYLPLKIQPNINPDCKDLRQKYNMENTDKNIDNNSQEVQQFEEKRKHYKINLIGEWCVSNPEKTMWIGFAIMFFGVVIGVIYETTYHYIIPIWVPVVKALWHGFIILGEAIAALFLVHSVIEKKSLKNNEVLLNESAERIHHKFNSLVSTFDKESQAKIKEIQENLFKAILHGMDIMPFEMVEYIHKAKYSTKFVRKNMKLSYVFEKEEKGGDIVIKQHIQFDVENTGDELIEEFFDMPLFLQGTSFVTYNLTDVTVNFTRQTHKRNPSESSFKYRLSDFTIGDDENMCLTKKIGMFGREIINVNQYIKTKFKLGGNQTVSDHYHSKIYTIGISIDVELPNEYKFTLIPSSPDNRAEKQSVAEVLKYNLAFFLPGQGFYFTIEKLEENSKSTVS